MSYATTVLISIGAVAVSVFGLFQGFKRGYRGEITRKDNPWQFWATSTILLLIGAMGLVMLLVGVLAVLQTR